MPTIAVTLPHLHRRSTCFSLPRSAGLPGRGGVLKMSGTRHCFGDGLCSTVPSAGKKHRHRSLKSSDNRQIISASLHFAEYHKQFSSHFLTIFRNEIDLSGIRYQKFPS